MSIDKSLVPRNRLKRPRSVLSRAERLEQLEQEGKWVDGNSVFSLPKVKVQVVKKKPKAAEQPEPEAAEGAEESTEEQEAPAAESS